MNPDQQRERQIFAEALQFTAGGKRAAFLTNACGEDIQLRSRIEALFEAYDQAGEFLQEPVAGVSSKTFVITTNMVPVTEKAGDKIGRYKLREQIGEGGCGVVYVAEQEEPVRRRVALKVIKLGMDTKQVVARFEAERQALALMDHPHIAKVLDAGATDTGRPYFVMELVRGIKITDYCDQNNLSTEERLKLFIQVCSAIQHAHQKGIIHRDIKPSNILVTLHDGVPVPKVIDFGIAKATSDQRLTDKTVYTAFEQFIGTPAYMSPEQAEMSGLDIDTRSDIYSLGVLLYELLTARTPFDAATLLKAGLDQMRRIIREQEPQRPSTRLSTLEDADLTTVANHRHSEPPKLLNLIRGDLDWIVMKSLEKDRTRRYETVNGLAADVKRHLDDEPVDARPPSLLYRLQKLLRKHKLAFAASTTVAVVVVIGLSAALLLHRNEQQARQRALESEKAQAELQMQVEIAELRRKARDPGYEEKEAEKLYRQVLAKCREHFGAKNPDAATAMEDLAVSLVNLHNQDQADTLSEAEELYREALSIRRALREDSRVTADTLGSLAGVLRESGKFAEAEASRREQIRLLQKLYGDEYWEVGDLTGELASLLADQGRAAEAESLYRDRLELKRTADTRGREMVDALEDLAFVLERQGKLPEAEVLLRQAFKNSDIDDHRINWLVSVCLRQGDFDGAEKIYRQILSLRRLLFQSTHLRVAYTLRRLSDVLDQMGKSNEAIAARREALGIEEKHLHGGNTNLLHHILLIAHDYADKTNQAAADRVFDEMISLCGTNSSNILSLLNARVQLRVCNWRLPAAAQDLKRLVAATPEEHWYAFQLSPLLVEIGDLNTYTNNYQALFAKFGSTNNLQVLERVAKASLLLPGTEASLKTARELIDRVISHGTNDPLSHYFFVTKGLCEYRHGNYSEAIRWAVKGNNDCVAALAILAMSHHRLEENSQAGSALRKAKTAAENQGMTVSIGGGYESEKVTLDQYWHDKLIDRILLREAEFVVNTRTPHANGSKK